MLSGAMTDSKNDIALNDLFQFIDRHKTQNVEIEPELHSFIPYYVPAIGELKKFQLFVFGRLCKEDTSASHRTHIYCMILR